MYPTVGTSSMLGSSSMEPSYATGLGYPAVGQAATTTYPSVGASAFSSSSVAQSSLVGGYPSLSPLAPSYATSQYQGVASQYPLAASASTQYPVVSNTSVVSQQYPVVGNTSVVAQQYPVVANTSVVTAQYPVLAETAVVAQPVPVVECIAPAVVEQQVVHNLQPLVQYEVAPPIVEYLPQPQIVIPQPPPQEKVRIVHVKDNECEGRCARLEEENARLRARIGQLEQEIHTMRMSKQTTDLHTTSRKSETYKVKTFDIAAKLAVSDGTDDGMYNDLPIEVEGLGLYRDLKAAGMRPSGGATASFRTSSQSKSETYKVKTLDIAERLSKMDGTDDGMYNGLPIEVEGMGIYNNIRRR